MLSAFIFKSHQLSYYFVKRWMKLEPIIQSEVNQTEKHQYRILTHIYGIQEDGNNNPVYETAIETLMCRTVLGTLWEKQRVGRFGRMTLKHVKYHVRNELPVQVRCTILDAWG